jgi:hypothetical protein
MGVASSFASFFFSTCIEQETDIDREEMKTEDADNSQDRDR